MYILYIILIQYSPLRIQFSEETDKAVFGLQRTVGSGSTLEGKVGSVSGSGWQEREEILPDQEDGQREDCDGDEANIF
jgi:hypothetical protein